MHLQSCFAADQRIAAVTETATVITEGIQAGVVPPPPPPPVYSDNDDVDRKAEKEMMTCFQVTDNEADGDDHDGDVVYDLCRHCSTKYHHHH
mmetsp:Transcript_17097/g.27324  ORF Transcript_17097/g.27324 Transcript_17097/m.27324 type:complete len:92 (-) Transcript_17097:383-658(-)